MSASVVLTRSTSFEALRTMPSGSLTCHAAALLRSGPAAYTAPQQPEWAARTAPPASSTTDLPAFFKPPTPPPAPLAGPPAPLPSVVTQPTAVEQQCEAAALADQLEDLLVFTGAPHTAQQEADPQLLVHSPTKSAAPGSGRQPARGSGASDGGMLTPRAAPAEAAGLAPGAGAGAGAAPAAAAVQLSPVSQLAVAEGPSLEELLRGPKPLREIALQVARSPLLRPTFSQELPPGLVLLEEDVAAAAVQPPAAPKQQPMASVRIPQVAAPLPPPLCLRSQAAPPTLLAAAAPAPCNGRGELPLSPSYCSGPLSPSKSSAGAGMIQLVDLHKGEWHQTHSHSAATSQGTIPSYCTDSDDSDSSDEEDEEGGSIQSRGYISQRPFSGRGCAPMLLGEQQGEEEEVQQGEAGLADAIMTPEGVRRVLQSSWSTPLLSAAVNPLPGDDLVGGGEVSMVDVPIRPAHPMSSPLSASFAAIHGSLECSMAAPGAAHVEEDLALPTPFGSGGSGAALQAQAQAAPSHLPHPASPAFARFLEMLRSGSSEFEAGGRVLRLRRYLRPDVPPSVLDAVLCALQENSRVEALYIQNFERGMGDAQLDRLVSVLRQGRIWAVNVGENFGVSRQAWERFCSALPHTAVGYLFVSEAHLQGSDLKARMRDAIRRNRRMSPPRDPQVIVHVGNMWWNPRLPGALPLTSEAADDSSHGDGGLPDIQVGSKRGSSDLEESLGAVSSTLLRRVSSHRVGFRGSLVPGASRATLLRPQPPKPREPLGAAAAAAAPLGAAAAAAGVPAIMLTRSRAGVIVGNSPGLAASEGVGVDDDDEDYHVEDDAPLTDDDFDDDDPFCRLRRRHASAVVPSRVSRRLQERAVAHPASAQLPLADQFVSMPVSAPASPSRSPAPAPKRQRGEQSRDSSSAGAPLHARAAVAGQDVEASSRAAVPAARAAAQPAARRPAAASRGARGGSAVRRAGGGSQRAQRGDLKGKPSFAELVESGFMRPGAYQFTVGAQEVSAIIEEDGGIRYAGSRFRAISKFALVVLRERNPSRQSCDGWKEVAWNGEKLDMLRVRFQQYVRQQARRSVPALA